MSHSIFGGAIKHVPILTRFCVVGAVNTAIDFGLFALLYYGAGIPLLIAHIAGFTTATVNSYAMNRRWTFRLKQSPHVSEAGSFLLINMGGLGLSSLVVAAASGALGALGAKAVAVIVTLAWNFMGAKWLFRAKHPANACIDHSE